MENSVKLQEFLLAINVTSSGTPEQKLEWAFRMYDIDGNGTIDEKEMIKIIEVRLVNQEEKVQRFNISDPKNNNFALVGARAEVK